MAIALVNSQTSSASGTTVTVTKPTGTLEGHVLVAQWATRAALLTGAMTLPDDWEEVVFLGVASGPTVKWAYKVAGASEPSTYDFTVSSSVAHSVGIAAWSGVDNTTPSDVAASTNSATSGTTLTATTITTVTDGALVLAGFANHTVTSTAITPPGDMTQAFSVTAQCRNILSYVTKETAGATGSEVATQASTARWTAIQWALRPAAVADVVLTVASTPHTTSRMEIGLSHIDDDMQGTLNTAKTRARANLSPATLWHNCHIYQFGVGSIMPYSGTNAEGANDWPTEPTMTNDLHTNLTIGRDLGAQHIITFFGIPWWMRGQTTWVSGSIAGGNLVQTHENATSTWEFGSQASDGRLRTDRVSHWENLVRKICRHTMKAYNASTAPYGVSARVFQIGNEFKGFTNKTREQDSQEHDWDDYTGSVGKADMGYTAFYKITLAIILEVATELSISHDDIKVGGPYPVISAKGITSADAITANRNDSTGASVNYAALIGRSYGFWNKASPEAVDEFLRLSTTGDGFKVDFLSVDFGTFLEDRYTQNHDDFFVAYNRYADMFTWLRERLVARGLDEDFPIVMGEWYTKPQDKKGDTGWTHYYAALKAVTYAAMLDYRVWIPLMWGPWGDGDQAHRDVTNTTNDPEGEPLTFSDPGKYQGGMLSLITSSTVGGEKQEHAYVAEAYTEYFPPGTSVYEVTANDSSLAFARANGTVAIVVSKVNVTQTVSVNGGAPVTLTPYETAVIAYAQGDYGILGDQADYTLTGQAAALRVARKLTAAQASFALTGQAATLTYFIPYVLPATQASFALTGQDATFLYGHRITVQTASFELTPSLAAIVVQPPSVLSAFMRDYFVTVPDTSLTVTRLLAAATGTFALTGQAAGVLRAAHLSATQATFTLTGQDITFHSVYVLSAQVSTLSLSGQAVTFTYAAIEVEFVEFETAMQLTTAFPLEMTFRANFDLELETELD
jgi:hypothetical protein